MQPILLALLCLSPVNTEMIKDRLRPMLMQEEGFRARLYQDTSDPPKWTIGYGRNLSDIGVSKEEALYLLERDMDKAIEACRRVYPDYANLDLVRQVVLADMCFNLGERGLSKFRRTLDAISRGAYGLAAEYMLQSRWYQQVGTRAAKLAMMMQTGEWHGVKPQ